MSLQATTSQTVGPYFKIGLQWLNRDNLVGEGVSGERVTIQGRVFDGDGVPVPDAILEIWQANAHGKYAHPEDTQDKPLEPGFKGYGRVAVSDEGLLVSVFMRGVLRRVVTRIYFPDEPRNAADFILNLVEPARRSTLIAKKTAGGPGTLEWNVVLQGPDETVFFDLGL
jgi:protocatechuate 3,4-dioxygenase, alpha subunit